MRSQFTIVRTPVPVYVSTVEDAVTWLDYFKREAEVEGIGVDTETTGLDIIKDRIRFFSIATRDARIAAPVRLLSVFEELLEDEYTEKRLTNAKYDQHMFANAGVRLRGHIVDTADMDFLIDENREGDHGLKECALEYLGLRMTPFKEVFGNAGTTDDEVETMCEIHDILELHDHEGAVRLAQAQALDVLLQLERVSGSPDLIKAVNKLRLSLKADACTLTARQVITVAETFGVIEQHSGTNRVVSEFFALLGNVGEVEVKQRRLLLPDTEDAVLLREVTQTVFDALLAQTGVPANPVEFLRTSVADYASLDAWGSFSLVPVMRKMLARPEMAMITEDVREGRATPRFLLQHYEEKRVPFLQTLWNMERRGFKIDLDGCRPYAIDMQKVVEQAERNIVRETGDIGFNPGSSKQLQAQFFRYQEGVGWLDPFGDEPKRWTGGGASGVKAPSTNHDVLEEFAGKGDKLAEYILEYRQFTKLKNDYMEGLPRWVDRNTRIHTGLKSTGTVTWRISSSKPNLQNIPAKDPVWGPKIRSLFVAGVWGDCSTDLCLEHLRDVAPPRLDPDQPMRLLISDYKQLEVCIVAHWCLHQHMRVSAPMKSRAIGAIVRQRWEGDVFSYDVETRKKVVRKVVDHFKNNQRAGDSRFRGGMLPEDWLIVRHEGAPAKALVITPQHQVYGADGKKRPIGTFKAGNSLLFEEPRLEGAVKQLVLGTVLGDGNFKRQRAPTNPDANYSAAYYQCDEQKEYFEFKTRVLGPHSASTMFDGRMHRGVISAGFQLSRIARDMCGKGKRRPTIAVLRQLEARGLAIWYCDDGTLMKDKRCSATKGFSLRLYNFFINQEEVDFLNQRFGLDFKLLKRGPALSGLRAEAFFALIAPHVPPCMEYKLPPHWRGKFDAATWEEEIDAVTPVKILEIRHGTSSDRILRVKGSGSRYDMTVEGLHNYFAQNVLVSNCQDQGMLDAIWAKQDQHCKTVAMASALGAAGLPKGITYEEALAAKKASGREGYTMTKDEEFLVNKRSNLKSSLFGIVYGIGGLKLGMQLKLKIIKHTDRRGRTRDVCPEADDLIDTIINQVYPRMGEWIKETHDLCADELAVYTVAGHPRRLPDIISNDGGRSSTARRQSVNTLAQGSGADIVNEAMIRCESDPELRRLGVRLLLQIHDELIFEVPDVPEFIEPAKKRIKKLMENPFPMRVPILVDIADGLSWAAKH